MVEVMIPGDLEHGHPQILYGINVGLHVVHSVPNHVSKSHAHYFVGFQRVGGLFQVGYGFAAETVKLLVVDDLRVGNRDKDKVVARLVSLLQCEIADVFCCICF